MQELLGRHRLLGPMRLYQIQHLWPSLVGHTTAARTWPTSLHDGRLVVHAADSTWVQELTFMKADLLQKIGAVLPPGSVSDLRLYVREGASAPQPGPPGGSADSSADHPPSLPSPAEVARALDELEQRLEGVRDPELRRSIRRAFLEHLLGG